MKHELCKVENAAKKFSDERTLLAAIVDDLNEALENAYRKHVPALRKAVGRVAERQTALEAMIAATPELFEKPRTLVLHGVRVGFRKGTGGLDWEDDDQVVKLIRKHFADKADVLILTKETPIKKALAALEVADLKRLGVTVEDTGDVVTVRPVDGAVEKTVKALLKNAAQELREEAA